MTFWKTVGAVLVAQLIINVAIIVLYAAIIPK